MARAQRDSQPPLEFSVDLKTDWELPSPLNEGARRLADREVIDTLLDYQRRGPGYYDTLTLRDRTRTRGKGLFARAELKILGGYRGEMLLPHSGFAVPEVVLIGLWQHQRGNPRFHVRFSPGDGDSRRHESIALAAQRLESGGRAYRDTVLVFSPDHPDSEGSLYTFGQTVIPARELPDIIDVTTRFSTSLDGYRSIALSRDARMRD